MSELIDEQLDAWSTLAALGKLDWIQQAKVCAEVRALRLRVSELTAEVAVLRAADDFDPNPMIVAYDAIGAERDALQARIYNARAIIDNCDEGPIEAEIRAALTGAAVPPETP